MLHTFFLLVFLSLSSAATANWWQPMLDWLTPAQTAQSTATPPAPERPVSAPILAQSLGSATLHSGLQQALEVGIQRAIRQLSATNGYWQNPAVRIPLPEQLQNVHSTLAKVGLSQHLTDLELRLNRAAEQAIVQAQAPFLRELQALTFTDALNFLQGPPDAITRHFEAKLGQGLQTVLHPLIASALVDVQAASLYETYRTQVNGYLQNPLFAPMLNLVGVQTTTVLDLPTYTTQRALAGFFQMLAQEEQAIRQNPAQRTTDLLQRIFAAPPQ